MAVGLSILRARAAFRRGSTKAVRMVRWQMTTDELVHGQWFAGRVFPERCDVSPDGELVVYFAMRRGDTFNAVSRPPYFTPLCVWVIQRTATTRRALGATATVADFNADVFEKQAPPAWALAWPAR